MIANPLNNPPASREVRLGFNPIFRDANNCRLRYRVLKGSAGSGKSVNVAQDYILKLSDKTYRGANLLCVRKVDDSNRYSTFAELQSAILRIYGQDAQKYWRVQKSPLSMRCLVTGNEILFLGMHDERQREKTKSVAFTRGKLTWIWCEEATEFTREDVDILDDRLRGDLSAVNENLYYQITLTFNPVSAAHWIKGAYFDRESPLVFTHHSTYLDNLFCDHQYHQRMMRRKVLDPEGYKIYGLGQWGEVGGLIFTNWQARAYPIGESHFDYMALGQDFGYNHANALLLLGFRDGQVYICKEVYVNERDTDEIIEIAKEQGFESYRHLRMWCDSAEPDRIKTWRRAGYRAVAVEKEPGCVNASIDWLKRRRLHVHPECVHTIRELQQWKWDKDRQSGRYIDQPVAYQDDAMAALRYGVEGWRKSGLLNVKEK